MADQWAGFKVVTDDSNDPWSSFKTVSSDVGTNSQAQAAPERPVYSSFGQAAGGAAKALGTGIAQGMVGLATLPGNLESLGRAGINAGAGLVGVEAPVSPEPFLIDYNEAKSRLEARHGDFYKPQTTGEEYLRTIGEFAPMAMTGGASAAGRAGQVLAPAIASETAGQVTEGTAYEPYARVAGALAGGTAANLGARTVTPAPAVDPVKAAHVAELERQGVKSLTAGQKTGNTRIRALEDASLTMPGGARAGQMQVKSLEEFTSAALQKAGIQGANRATPDVIENGFNQLGKQYEQVGQVARVVGDRAFGMRIGSVAADYAKVTPPAQRVPLISSLTSDIRQASTKPGGMTGQEYLGFRSNMRRAQRGMTNNPQAREALGKLVEHLDAQMIRSAPKNIRPQVAKYMQDLNEKYRNLLAIDATVLRQGDKSAIGLISPQSLNAELKKQSKRARSNRELGRLAAAGDDILRDLKSSGTAERNQAISMLKSPSSMISGIAGGALSGDPLVALASWAAPVAVQTAAARGITNPMLQRYMANQTLTSRVNPEMSRRVGTAQTPFMLNREDLQDDPAALGRYLATR
jgi:hypothetical protein